VFLVKISQRYLGAMLFKHLKTVRFTCLLINSSIVFQPKLWTRGLLKNIEARKKNRYS